LSNKEKTKKKTLSQLFGTKIEEIDEKIHLAPQMPTYTTLVAICNLRNIATDAVHTANANIYYVSGN
jgi:hypothetical protein